MLFGDRENSVGIWCVIMTLLHIEVVVILFLLANIYDEIINEHRNLFKS